ncbi:MAG: hypothetical protein JWO11_2907 [Nocardioides sp.]|nr:hypothetical protein [Nocardioides sp.]
MTQPTNPWSGFSHDPREPAHAALRASDLDRDLVQQVLTEAYADGRLDRAEFDERSEHTVAARTLGELPPLMQDLVSSRALAKPGSTDLATATPDELRARAVEKYASDRREALLGFLGPSLICWAIWAAVMLGGFPWPLFVMLGTGINLLRTLVRRSDIIEGHVRSLERKQAKALKPKKTDGPDPE